MMLIEEKGKQTLKLMFTKSFWYLTLYNTCIKYKVLIFPWNSTNLTVKWCNNSIQGFSMHFSHIYSNNHT